MYNLSPLLLYASPMFCVISIFSPSCTVFQAVRLESTYPGRVRYMTVVSTLGRQDTEESIILGIDMIRVPRRHHSNQDDNVLQVPCDIEHGHPPGKAEVHKLRFCHAQSSVSSRYIYIHIIVTHCRLPSCWLVFTARGYVLCTIMIPSHKDFKIWSLILLHRCQFWFEIIQCQFWFEIIVFRPVLSYYTILLLLH